MDYIKWIRSKVGSEMIILNFAGAIITNEEGHILLQRRRDKDAWGFPRRVFRRYIQPAKSDAPFPAVT